MSRYFTGLPCRNGHIAERLVSNATCLDCQLATNVRGRQRDPERFRRYSRETGQRFKEAHPGYSAAIARKHAHKRAAYRAAWVRANRDRVLAAKRRWKARNAAWAAAWARKRAARLHRATPWWLSPEQHAQMEAVYVEASRRGPDWHVDHIIPLNGKTVCGLHVPWNLQLLPAVENMRKGNRLEVAA